MSRMACVLGIGSPHGDDQAGWHCVELLRRHPAAVDLEAIAIAEVTQILNHVQDCKRMAIVDACCSGAPAGTVTQYVWPDPRIMHQGRRSTHGISVADTLKLAEQLGQLPAEVLLFCVEIGDCRPSAKMSRTVANSLPALVDHIAMKCCRATPSHRGPTGDGVCAVNGPIGGA